MKRHEVVGGLLFAFALAGGAGCGSSTDNTNTGTTHADAGQDLGTNIDASGDVEDASLDGADADDVGDAGADVEDAGQVPDVGVPPEDTGNPVVDSGTPPPEDAGMTAGVCPAACAVSSDCDPCWSAGEVHGSNNYCCVSGLCIFRTGTCDVTPPPPADGGTGPGGGTDGGLPALDASPGGGGGADGGGTMPGGGTDGGGLGGLG